MNITILHLVEGAKNARGLTVVIDVFRAFSLAAYAFGAGVKKIIPVSQVETALKIKNEHPEYILVGERDEKMVPGFDYGNSPSHILKANLRDKVMVHTTSAGTQGIVNAKDADEVITGAFVNASAIVEYIRKKNPENLSLVCMGYAARHPIEEDTFCAEYIRNELQGKKSDFNGYVDIIRQTSGKRFFDKKKQSFSPSSDFDLCLNLNQFDFVLKANKTKTFGIHLQKIELK
ncbi:MAG: 2-phosphosulfolactate phosphatase [Bacteroidota bacterium]